MSFLLHFYSCLVVAMPCCAVVGCTSHSRNAKELGISFHRFPKEESLRKQWISVCGLKQEAQPNSRVCSNHFEEKDFQQDLKAQILRLSRKAVLKPGVIPKQSPNLVESPTLLELNPNDIFKAKLTQEEKENKNESPTK